MTAIRIADRIDVDLVEYLVVVLPGLDAIPGVAAELHALGRSRSISILDVVVVSLAADGSATVIEPDWMSSLSSFQAHRRGTGLLLSTHDIELIALALEPGDCAVIVLAEDRWAAPLSAAAHAVGGELRAGERVSRQRVRAAIGEPSWATA